MGQEITPEEFNRRWKSRLKKGHYGMGISDPKIIKLVDKEFRSLEKKYPNFTYSQIKIKFGSARVYLENVPSKEINRIEMNINLILDEE